MNILGISAFYHDSAACLVRDGEIIAAAQEERFTRKKHDFHFPINAVEYCLKEAGISAGDIDYVGFYDKPFIKFERILYSYLAYAPVGIRSFFKAIPLWIKQKLFIRDIVKKEIGYKGDVLFPEHHESHAASAFYPSPFSDAAILTVDAVGEWATTSYGIGEENKIKILSELKFPHSLGLLYSAFTYYTGFKVNSAEYKVMGLAPYGEPKYVDTIFNELMDLKEDGSFKLNMKYFNYCTGLTMTNSRFDKLFGGPPAKSESSVTQREMDLARSIQVVTEEIVYRMANHVHKETGKKNLCLAGGVALNCVSNGKLLREGPFDNLWIQPAAGDAGGALGVALLIWYEYLGKDRIAEEAKVMQKASYLGNHYEDKEIEEFLVKEGAPFVKLKTEEIPSRIAELIADENVIGWFEGRMEFGPRSLGSRSIIGDPRSKEMQSIMNVKIKYRESFRPFAPSVLREHVSDYFDINCESPYMLLVANLKDEKKIKMSGEEEKLFGLEKLKVVRSDVPAITHVDYSARIQTVTRDDNPLYYGVIEEFYKKTGCPMIVNTSFNIRGEPIVCRPEEAYKCFMRTGMDYLIMGSYLLDKRRQIPVEDDIDWKKEFDPD
ncbi:MAG: carbamoyltransferase [Candidatus Scalindua sp.]|jgi:carbamoyltransferase|nr:carbamoyltransferase [Candidatus Scalindua sp.]MBT5303575.1 carbamoyltransferase [Candidatus Scalindua sp.]MBT6050437.1 carbamoyltransferase [Candidatus Scalindua sp.]MBT6231439.1 carbamoyltransferase [Candidatus Scalindua sp.]MBT6561889.1 carbamoyltransferase [Candidatus Scalindua sp.]